MRRQSLIALGIALVLGLLAVYFANVFLTRNENAAADAKAGTMRVAVAAVPLDYGMELSPDKIRFADLPASSLPVGTYSQMGDLFPAGQKRVALRRMEVNEPILKSKISGEGQNASIAALLPDGKRAAAVRINDVSGVAGFVQPNDSVDVLVTRQEVAAQGSAALQRTDVLLQNVKVLAIDQTAKNPDGTPMVAKTATLEVDPLDAQKLALAQQVGTLSLVLRKPGEEQNMAAVATVSMSDLRYSYYGGARPAGGGLPGAISGSMNNTARVIAASSAPPRRPQVSVRRTAPAPARQQGPSVEVVRGTEGSKYEVTRYGS
jgi:pilus assembly protein CpaB